MKYRVLWNLILRSICFVGRIKLFLLYNPLKLFDVHNFKCGIVACLSFRWRGYWSCEIFCIHGHVKIVVDMNKWWMYQLSNRYFCLREHSLFIVGKLLLRWSSSTIVGTKKTWDVYDSVISPANLIIVGYIQSSIVRLLSSPVYKHSLW